MRLGLRHAEPRELPGVEQPARDLLLFICRHEMIFVEGPLRVLNDEADRDLVLRRQFEIALIMGRHRHDCAGAILVQDKVRDPDRNAGLRKWIEGVSPGEHAFFFTIRGKTDRLVLPGHPSDGFPHGRRL